LTSPKLSAMRSPRAPDPSGLDLDPYSESDLPVERERRRSADLGIVDRHRRERIDTGYGGRDRRKIYYEDREDPRRDGRERDDRDGEDPYRDRRERNDGDREGPRREKEHRRRDYQHPYYSSVSDSDTQEAANPRRKPPNPRPATGTGFDGKNALDLEGFEEALARNPDLPSSLPGPASSLTTPAGMLPSFPPSSKSLNLDDAATRTSLRQPLHVYRSNGSARATFQKTRSIQQ
jgi:hypothetical protein